MADEPPLGLRHGHRGLYALGRLPGDDRIRGVVTEQHLEREAAPADDELRRALMSAYGSDFGVHDVSWLSRFTDAARQAAGYRQARVLLAGDAAHVHSPVGGQGLNTGLQDAVNLGWKLAQVVHGRSSDSLLDSYHAERHPVGAALLERTLALTALNRGDDRSTAMRALMGQMVRMDEPRRWYCATMAGLDVRYGPDEGHPLLGRRVPDFDLRVGGKSVRLFELLHDARGVLLNLTTAGPFVLDGWADRVAMVDAQLLGACELPVIGTVATPDALLIRPDGHVAWVGTGDTEGLADALGAWFGNQDSAREPVSPS